MIGGARVAAAVAKGMSSRAMPAPCPSARMRAKNPPLAAARTRTIRTDRPEAVGESDIPRLTGDLAGLLDVLGVERAVFVGHDWGGTVAWMMPLLHRERVAGVIGVNTPYFPRPSAPPISLMRMMYGDNYYMVHFQQPGVADAALARDVRRVFTRMMRAGVPQEEFRETVRQKAGPGMHNMIELIERDAYAGPPLLSEAELQVYVDTFERTGFTGGINWYRNLDRNWETTPQLAGAQIEVPSLMITAEWDPVLRPELAEAMRGLVADLEVTVISGCGHWTPQEKPAELNRIMVDWLTRRSRPGAGAALFSWPRSLRYKALLFRSEKGET